MCPSLVDLLPDFGKPEPGALTAGAMEFHFPDDALPPPEAQPEPDVDALIAEAVALAVAEAEVRVAERAEAAHRRELAAERARHAAVVAEMEEVYGRRAGDTLRTQIAELEDRLADLTGAVTARILAPVLGADLQRRALATLEAAIRGALRDAGALRMRVRGPLSLFEPLQQSLGELAERIEFVEGDGFDLTLEIEDALFETKLSEWATMIAEVVE